MSDKIKKVLSVLLSSDDGPDNLTAEQVDEAARRFRYNLKKVGKYDDKLVDRAVQYYVTKGLEKKKGNKKTADFFVQCLHQCLQSLFFRTSEDSAGTLMVGPLARALTYVSQTADLNTELAMILPLVSPLTKEQEALLNEFVPKNTEDEPSGRVSRLLGIA